MSKCKERVWDNGDTVDCANELPCEQHQHRHVSQHHMESYLLLDEIRKSVSILSQKLTASERRVTELDSALRREREKASIKRCYSFEEYTRGRLQAQGPIDCSTSSRLILGALGLAGEAGEFTEIVKKHIYHGKLLNKEKAIKELGDILWYVMYSAAALGSTLEEVALANVIKLGEERFPASQLP